VCRDAAPYRYRVEELSKPENVTDGFGASGMKTKKDIRNMFSDNFVFGCEPDAII
jgi:hypothetical protein